MSSDADKLQKKAYIRYLSNKIRKWSPKPGLQFVEEDPVIGGIDGLARSIMLTVCRNRQRLLQQAWDYWTRNTEVVHDYTYDMKQILSHPLAENEMRSELEIEVLYKWVCQNAHKDFTGIAASIMRCTRHKSIIQCLQHCRMETFSPGEPILFQGTLPRPEDGHFTILSGSCDVLQYAEETVAFMKIQNYAKTRRFESAKSLLKESTVLAIMRAPAGFGELSSLTGVKRAATVRASLDQRDDNHCRIPGSTPCNTSVLVVPRRELLSVLEYRRGDGAMEGSAPSEAIELFRTTGLAARIDTKDLMAAASSMIKHTLSEGEVLFERGQKAERLFLVVSGEFVLDTTEPDATNCNKQGKFEAFMKSTSDHVFHLSGGSILGDEGILGFSSAYVSTAAVVSEMAVIFEAKGFSKKFLYDKVKAMRYAALAYKELPRWTVPIADAETNNLYGNLNSLRRVVAFCQPWRGKTHNWHIREEDLKAKAFEAVKPIIDARKKERAAAQKTSKSAAETEAEKKAGIEAAKKKSLEEKKRLEKDAKRRAAALEKQEATLLATDEESETKRYSSLRVLNLLELAAARELNRINKQVLADGVQMHARVNILQDQLLKENNNTELDDEKGEEELAAESEALEAEAEVAAKAALCGEELPEKEVEIPPEIDAEEMSRKARKKYLVQVQNKLKAALASYLDRQEAYVDEEKSEEDEALRVGEAAAIISMFKSAAAQGMKGQDDLDEGNGEEDSEDWFKSPDSLIVQEGLKLPGETDEEYKLRVGAKLKEPRMKLYLEYLLTSKENDELSNKVELVNTEIFTESTPENTTTGAMVASDGFASSQKHDTKQPGKHTSYFRSPEEMGTGPPPSMVNTTNWRPPSSPSRPGAGIASGKLVAETFSMATQLHGPKNVERKSPWKEREPKFVRFENRKDASLNSLSFDRQFYKTFAERMKDIPSSGYGQKHIEKAAQAALGMTLNEFREEAKFHRPAPPILHRRVILPDGMLAVIKPYAKKKPNKHHDHQKTIPTSMMGLGVGLMDTIGPLKEFSAWSLDLESPGGFVQSLHDKDFSARRKFLTKNGWNTRSMKVTDNSTDTTGDGSSNWFAAECRALGIADTDGLDKKYEKLRTLKGASPALDHTATLPRDSDAEQRSDTRSSLSPHRSCQASQQATRTQSPRHDDEVGAENAENGPWGTLNEANLETHSHGDNGDDASHEGELRRIQSQLTNATMDTALTGFTTNDGGSIDAEATGLVPPHFMDSENDETENGKNIEAEPGEKMKGTVQAKKSSKKEKKNDREPQYHVLKLPSESLKKYADTVSEDYESRKFLEGKKRCHLVSRFALPVAGEVHELGPNGQDNAPDAIAARKTAELYANKKKDQALISSLLPAHLHNAAALDKTRREQEKKRRRDAGLNSLASTESLDSISKATALSQMRDTFKKTKGETMNEVEAWKDFSVKVSVRSKLGPSKSLPVLAIAAKDPFTKPPKKSSLKFGSGNLAESEGLDALEFKKFSSYLDVYKATYAHSKKQK